MCMQIGLFSLASTESNCSQGILIFKKVELYCLMIKGGRAFLSAWQERRKETIRHPFLGEKMEWGLVPSVQAMLLARTLRGDLEEYPPFLWK